MSAGAEEPARLTPRDHAILRGIAIHRPLAPRGYYTVLNAKLSGAELIEGAEPDTVALDSVVRYRIGAGSVLEHRLVVGNFEPLMGRTLSVRTLVGVALIGARAGASLTLPGADGESLVVEAVSGGAAAAE